MMNERNKTALVAGSGIAAAFVCANLIQQDVRVIHFADPALQGASHIAAGLVNPVTGRQYAVSWRTVECLDALDRFFQIPWLASAQSYFHAMQIYRPFPDIFSLNEWTAKTTRPEFEGLTDIAYTPWRPELIHNPHGGMLHHRGGWLDIPNFLKHVQQLFLRSGRYRHIPEKLWYDKLHPEAHSYTLHTENLPYDAVIFCEGMGMTENPFFRVQLAPLKGQILSIRAAADMDRIVSSGIFVVPLGDGLFRLGSTYERNYTHAMPDAAGVSELQSEASRWWKPGAMDVVQHVAGIRPSTADRMPILGRHDLYPALWILNGLGAKGVLQGPRMAEIITDAILQDSEAGVYPETHWKRSRIYSA
jgi:glycine/D-amino acid oxidase-like deaminating enzyme